MRRPARLPPLSESPAFTGILAFAAAGICLLIWAGAGALHARHWRDVTGREGGPDKGCLHCHVTPPPPPVSGALGRGPRYISPEGMAVSPDGGTLFVAGEGGNLLLKVDVARGKVLAATDLPGRPHEVELLPGGRRIAVSSRDTDRILILSADTLELLQTVDTGAEPVGFAVSPDGSRFFVADAMADELLIAPLDPAEERIHLPAGADPYAVAFSPASGIVAVANRRAAPVPPRTVPHSEITLVDSKRGRVTDRRRLVSAHLAEGIAFSSDGSFVLVPALRIRNLLPTTQVSRGAVMNSVLAFVETRAGGKTVQFPLAEANRFFADPCGVVITPDDRLAFVAHGGSRDVTVVDVRALRRIVDRRAPARLRELEDDLTASFDYVVAHLATGFNPRKLALSPDGNRLFVAETLGDSVAVFDTESLELLKRIDLGGPKALTAERRGRRTFYDASATFQGQFSCRSCHPDGHTDGLVWDFEIDGAGRELLETRSLRGIKHTAPFKWRGKNATIHRQCGRRFARVLTRSDAFEGRKLDDLVKFIESIPVPPKRISPKVAAAIERGRELFFRTHDADGDPIPVGQRCSTCHGGPLYTDRMMSDVGTDGAFDNPYLFDVGSSPPYLHDGRALTLEEIWTVHDSSRTHGATKDMNKVMLNDLVSYLRTL